MKLLQVPNASLKFVRANGSQVFFGVLLLLFRRNSTNIKLDRITNRKYIGALQFSAIKMDSGSFDGAAEQPV